MKKLLLVSAIFLFGQSGMALAQTPEPEACPSVEAIRTVGLNAAENFLNDHTWAVDHLSSKYDTTEQWSFVLMGVQGTDQAEAIKNGNKLLPALKFEAGPAPGSENKTWACLYSTEEQSVSGFALTPPLSQSNLSKMAVKFR